MPLEKYKRNMILKGISEYNLIYVHVKWLTEMKGKKSMNNYRQKQYHKAVQPPKKKILEKKQVWDIKNRQELQKKLSQNNKTC